MEEVYEVNGVHEPHELYDAWRRFRRGKRARRAIDEFGYDIEHKLYDLHQAIATRTYQHGLYQNLVVREKKERQLAVAAVRDRVVHRLVYDKLTLAYDHTFDPDVWSCRRGKGLHGCLARAQQLLRRHSHAYVWRMDITKFFDTIDHQVLEAAVLRRVSRPDLRWLCQEIIGSYHHEPEGKGTPIGNLTSQVFANIYLNELDRHIRHTLKPLAYVRYGDDLVVWCITRRQARIFRGQTIRFLATKLHLAVNPKNDVIVPARAGLHFLGHVVTGSYIVVDRHTTRAVLGKVHGGNIASYKSLLLAKTPKMQLDWQYVDELDSLDY